MSCLMLVVTAGSTCGAYDVFRGDARQPPYTVYGTVESLPTLVSRMRARNCNCKSGILIFHGHSGSSAFMQKMSVISDVAVLGFEPLEKFSPAKNATAALHKADAFYTKRIEEGRFPMLKTRPWPILMEPAKWKDFARKHSTCPLWMTRNNALEVLFEEMREIFASGVTPTQLRAEGSMDPAVWHKRFGHNRSQRQFRLNAMLNVTVLDYVSPQRIPMDVARALLRSVPQRESTPEHKKRSNCQKWDDLQSLRDKSWVLFCLARHMRARCSKVVNYDDLLYQHDKLFLGVAALLGLRLDVGMLRDMHVQLKTKTKAQVGAGGTAVVKNFVKTSLPGLCSKFTNFEELCELARAEFPHHLWMFDDPANGCIC